MIMPGYSQQQFKHCIPLCSESVDTRLSITFRCIPENSPVRDANPHHQTYSARLRENYQVNRVYQSSNTGEVTKCLILHDSIYNNFNEQHLKDTKTELRSIKTLQRLTTTKTLGYLKGNNLLKAADAVVVHLGVNDLKHSPIHTVMEDLKATLLNLAQSSNGKIFFSLVLPVGDPALDRQVKDFNRQATSLIGRLRQKTYLKQRLYTVFNTNFTGKSHHELTNFYEDHIHINSRGTTMLLGHLDKVIKSVLARDSAPSQTHY